MISVVIPCYNCEKLIYRAVNSVLLQTYTDYEIILVDNNSTDDTNDVIHDIQLMHPGKVTCYFEGKKGAPYARNRGLLEAKGEFIQFLDADDELTSDKLERQVAIASQSNADVVVGGSALLYETGKGGYKKHIKHPDKDIWAGLINSNLGITSANLWRKSSLSSVGGWDGHLTSSQEYDLLFRLLKNGAKIEVDDAVSAIIFKSDSTISKSNNIKKQEEIILNRITLREQIKTFLFQAGLLSAELKRMADTYIYNELVLNVSPASSMRLDYLTTHELDVVKPNYLKTKVKNFTKRLGLR
ncbi:glycosyltransferase family 2 protein [Mucilaginibacter agri]|uniref:Glycosyltransferase n=1 Tax=Mucilaginibacter agri TaxID=2695265 RepID=A0A966DUI2_9SPHI|nr:glycosyltransferase family A protein [Mucilaginibacter agri]NCD72398.1 glycosyltransferase [Mucilaginibacter agri]